jgi:SAM-dependent methyltransferase
MVDDEKSRIVATYSAAADHFDDPRLGFWDYFGRRTVERLALRPGGRVLDVCCGTGASALPAAEAVGSAGEVIGVDLTPALLDLARAKARLRGLANVRFECADFEAMTEPAEELDAVVCVFGIFFFADMNDALRALWRRVRPGGVLAVTIWGEEVLEPGERFFWEAVRAERADLDRAFNPWDRIRTPQALEGAFAEAGIPGARAEPETWTLALAAPEDFWAVLLGGGYRGTLDQLDAAARERVRREVTARLRQEGVSRLRVPAIYGTAQRPSPRCRTL